MILAGLDAYATQGAAGALKAWTKGGSMESDPKVLASTEVFHEVEKFYGKYIGYTVIKQKDLTPTSRFVYIQINYEKGPFFTRFLCYLSGGQWVLAGRLALDTDPDRVL